MKPRGKALDLFLGALAVGAAVGVLFRRKPAGVAAPTAAATSQQPFSGRKWAGSVARTIRMEMRDDETITIAAALAFYATLAVIPAAFAAVSIYGLVLDPTDVADQIEAISDVLPESVKDNVASEVTRLADTSNAGLGVGLIVSLLGTLWVASGGIRALLHGINLVYNVEERRPWLIQRAMAYGMTLGMIVFGLTTVAVVTFLPGWLEDLGLGSSGVLLIEIGRWPAIFAIVVTGLAILYRIGPNLRGRSNHVLFPGALGAAALWLLATLGFSIYTGSALSNFDSGTYGALTSVVVVLIWFFVSGFTILLGAEVNATLEARRTER